MGKLLRTLLAIATFTVVWLVAAPSQALAFTGLGTAPLCDPRGAITFAPPPQMQDPELSLDIPPDCQVESPLETMNLGRGRPAPIDFSLSMDPLTAMPMRIPALSFSERVAAPKAERAPPRRGVTSSIERPPRA